MTPLTLTIIRAALACDTTVTPDDARRVEAAIAGQIDAPPACVRFGDVARRLGVTPRTVRSYVRRGLLEAVKPAAGRALGVTGASVNSLIGRKP